MLTWCLINFGSILEIFKTFKSRENRRISHNQWGSTITEILIILFYLLPAQFFGRISRVCKANLTFHITLPINALCPLKIFKKTTMYNDSLDKMSHFSSNHLMLSLGSHSSDCLKNNIIWLVYLNLDPSKFHVLHLTDEFLRLRL